MPKYYLFIFLWIQSKKVQKTTFTSFAIASIIIAFMIPFSPPILPIMPTS